MPSSPLRTVSIAAAGVYALQAAALSIVLAVTGATTPLPVLAAFRGKADTASLAIASVDLGWALVTLAIGGAVTHALVAQRSTSTSQSRAEGPHRDAESNATRGRVLLVAGWSQGSAILVFLIAQLNGIAELTSLVPLYAITATAVVLVGIDRGAGSTWGRPGAWAAAVGIVPWGVIAFAQIGTGLTVGALPLSVRIVTLMALAVAICGWVLGWRRRGLIRVSDVVTMTVAVSVLVWAIVGFVVL